MRLFLTTASVVAIFGMVIGQPAYACVSVEDTPVLAQQSAPSDSGAGGEADEKAKKPGREYGGWIKRRMDRRLKRLATKFEETETLRQCLQPSRIRNSQAIGDERIMFMARGGDIWVNELQQSCPNLMREDRFIYNLQGGMLCRAQIITVIDPFGRPWNSCALGDFKLFKKKRDGDKDEKNANNAEGGTTPANAVD